MPQLSSHFPAIPAPVAVPLTQLPLATCPYNRSRVSQIRAMLAGRMDASIYHDFMDAGFRRSGRMIYQPICPRCRRCVQIRVPVDRFVMSKSQRRVIRRNADLTVTAAAPSSTDEKHQLYRRYLEGRHTGEQDASREGMEAFLYDSPIDTVEFEYRLPGGQLIAVGICDLSERSLSSVYYYFAPDHARRSLGNFGVLQEIAFCRAHSLPHLYLGYWVEDAESMRYKASFKPFELLGTDGEWRAGGDAGE